MMSSDKNTASEIDELRRAWYQHVLNSLEKLDRSIDSLSDDLNSVKEKLRSEIDVIRKEEGNKELSKIKEKFVDEINELKEKTINPIIIEHGKLSTRLILLSSIFGACGAAFIGILIGLLKYVFQIG